MHNIQKLLHKSSSGTKDIVFLVIKMTRGIALNQKP